MNINPYKPPTKAVVETREREEKQQYRLSYYFTALSVFNGAMAGSILTILIYQQFWRSQNGSAFPFLPSSLAGAFAGALTGILYVTVVNRRARQRIKTSTLSELENANEGLRQ